MVGLVHHKAARGQPDGGLQELGEGPGAELAERLLPALDGARYPDPETARHALVEGNGLSGTGVDEAVRLESRWCRLAAVSGRDASVAGAVDDHESATADAAGIRLCHAEGGGRGHGGIHRVASVIKHLHAHLRGV